MKIKFNPIKQAEGIHQIVQHLNSLPSAIDSFLEGYILESKLYDIELDSKKAGLTAIYQEKLISQFFLAPAHRRYGQKVFAAVKRLEEVEVAFVPTCDEFFLSHALDNYQQLAKQAYFFATPVHLPSTTELSYTLCQANESNVDYIVGAGIFGDAAMVRNKIANQELFLTLSSEGVVGCGIIERSKLLNGIASIGMFVSENQRQKGIGTAILKLLLTECQNQNLRPVAGCGYSNHMSKKTLERAGMFTQTRLLSVEF